MAAAASPGTEGPSGRLDIAPAWDSAKNATPVRGAAGSRIDPSRWAFSADHGHSGPAAVGGGKFDEITDEMCGKADGALSQPDNPR